MPFIKVGKNKYRTPSGRIYTAKQVKEYRARKRRKAKAKAKGKRKRSRGK
jgi:hypothetical protein